MCPRTQNLECTLLDRLYELGNRETNYTWRDRDNIHSC